MHCCVRRLLWTFLKAANVVFRGVAQRVELLILIQAVVRSNRAALPDEHVDVGLFRGRSPETSR